MGAKEKGFAADEEKRDRLPGLVSDKTYQINWCECRVGQHVPDNTCESHVGQDVPNNPV